MRHFKYIGTNLLFLMLVLLGGSVLLLLSLLGSSSESQYEMEGALFLDVVVTGRERDYEWCRQ